MKRCVFPPSIFPNYHGSISNDDQAGSRFSEDELSDILEIIQGVFDEDEALIPAGAEDVKMEKIANKLLGASKKKRRVKRKV